MKPNPYTKEMIKWIRKNYTKNPDMTRKELLPLFNKTFNMNINIMLMDSVISRYKLASGFGRTKYTPKIKRFILKCVKKRMTRKECRIECEKKFGKKFDETNIGLMAKKMGIGFGDAAKKMDAVFDIPEVEELIKDIIKKNPKSTQQIILIRDILIEKYDKNISSSNIRKFCERKNIKLKTN